MALSTATGWTKTKGLIKLIWITSLLFSSFPPPCTGWILSFHTPKMSHFWIIACFKWKQISLNMKNLIGIIPIFSENVASNKIWGHSQNLHRFGPFYHWQHPKLILEAATDWLEIQLGTNSHQHWIFSLNNSLQNPKCTKEVIDIIVSDSIWHCYPKSILEAVNDKNDPNPCQFWEWPQITFEATHV